MKVKEHFMEVTMTEYGLKVTVADCEQTDAEIAAAMQAEAARLQKISDNATRAQNAHLFATGELK